MRGSCHFIPRSRSESDLYVLSQGISGPDCLHKVRQPTARAEGAPAPHLGFFFFLKSYGSVFAREFQTMQRDRALAEEKK